MFQVLVVPSASRGQGAVRRAEGLTGRSASAVPERGHESELSASGGGGGVGSSTLSVSKPLASDDSHWGRQRKRRLLSCRRPSSRAPGPREVVRSGSQPPGAEPVLAHGSPASGGSGEQREDWKCVKEHAA